MPKKQLKEIFPTARIARLDLDTAKSRSAYEQIIADFEAQRTDVLIGTQMVSKGLDFDHVSVVGVCVVLFGTTAPDNSNFVSIILLLII